MSTFEGFLNAIGWEAEEPQDETATLSRLLEPFKSFLDAPAFFTGENERRFEAKLMLSANLYLECILLEAVATP